MKFLFTSIVMLSMTACLAVPHQQSAVDRHSKSLPYFLQLSYNICVSHGFGKQQQLQQCTITDAAMNCKLYKLDLPICDKLLGRIDGPYVWPT